MLGLVHCAALMVSPGAPMDGEGPPARPGAGRGAWRPGGGAPSACRGHPARRRITRTRAACEVGTVAGLGRAGCLGWAAPPGGSGQRAAPRRASGPSRSAVGGAPVRRPGTRPHCPGPVAPDGRPTCPCPVPLPPQMDDLPTCQNASPLPAPAAPEGINVDDLGDGDYELPLEVEDAPVGALFTRGVSTAPPHPRPSHGPSPVRRAPALRPVSLARVRDPLRGGPTSVG